MAFPALDSVLLIDMIIRIYQVTVGGMNIRERFCSSLFFTGRRIQGEPKKRGHRLMTTVLSNLDQFKKIHWKIPW